MKIQTLAGLKAAFEDCRRKKRHVRGGCTRGAVGSRASRSGAWVGAASGTRARDAGEDVRGARDASLRPPVPALTAHGPPTQPADFGAWLAVHGCFSILGRSFRSLIQV